MDWISSLFCTHSAVQTVVLLSLIIAFGLAMGKFHVRGISLGVAFVFFMGIVAGSLHFSADEGMLSFAETFGLSIFVYALGLHVGPNFVCLMRNEGITLNLWGLAVIILGTVMALCLCLVLPVSVPDMVGILCGATTNTPALGAAQQALAAAHLPSSGAALGCAVTYPLGVVGVIIAMIFIRKFFVKPSDLEPHRIGDDDQTFVGQFVVVNPAIAGRTIAQISQMTHRHFIVSRIWRKGKVIVPMANTQIYINDNVLVVTNRDEVPAMDILFGERVEKDWNRDKIDWNAIDSTVESRVIVMTRTRLNGKTLGSLHMRETYGVNVSRVMRGDIKLLATDTLRLQYGDRLTVVGTPEDIDHTEAFIGNAVQVLNEPNLGAIFFGLFLGMALGMIPVNIPGMSAPVRLGIAGGPIIVGLIALRSRKFDFGTICGLLCGSMANPMALSYANDTVPGDRAAVAYTSVYPLGMFIRVIIAQVIIMFMV